MRRAITSVLTALAMGLLMAVPASADVIEQRYKTDNCGWVADLYGWIDLKDNGTPANTDDDLIDFDAIQGNPNRDVDVRPATPSKVNWIELTFRKDQADGSGHVTYYQSTRYLWGGGSNSETWNLTNVGTVQKDRKPYLRVEIALAGDPNCVMFIAFNDAWIP